MPRAYQRSTRLLAALLCGLGLAMVAMALVRGGGPLSLGVVIGGSFAVYGALRFALTRPPGARRPRA